MNKDNAKLFLPLVQALAEGKTLQVGIPGGEYVDRYEVVFGGEIENYRIKPVPPIERWAVINTSGPLGFAEALTIPADQSVTNKQYFAVRPQYKLIKLREVIEE